MIGPNKVCENLDGENADELTNQNNASENKKECQESKYIDCGEQTRPKCTKYVARNTGPMYIALGVIN